MIITTYLRARHSLMANFLIIDSNLISHWHDIGALDTFDKAMVVEAITSVTDLFVVFTNSKLVHSYFGSIFSLKNQES